YDVDNGNMLMVVKRLGAELLQSTLAFDALLRRGSSRSEAASRIARQARELDPRIPLALVEVEPEEHEKKVRNCPIDQLSAGMIIDNEVRTGSGLLVIARNQEVTPSIILKLKNYCEKGAIGAEVVVSVGKTAAAA